MIIVLTEERSMAETVRCLMERHRSDLAEGLDWFVFSYNGKSDLERNGKRQIILPAACGGANGTAALHAARTTAAVPEGTGCCARISSASFAGVSFAASSGVVLLVTRSSTTSR